MPLKAKFKHGAILPFILLVLITLGCSRDQMLFSDYQPLKFDGNGLVPEETLLKKDHFDRVESVLNYYKIPFQRTSPTSIEFSDPVDSETMWNFTIKAEDENWLQAHPVKNGA